MAEHITITRGQAVIRLDLAAWKWLPERKDEDSQILATHANSMWPSSYRGGPSEGRAGYSDASQLARRIGGKVHLPPVPPANPNLVY